MDQNSNNITLGDILRLFKGKLKKMICFALVVGILAGAVGAALVFVSAEYSGSVLLHLAPQDASRAIMSLVSSDRFAEALLLDEYGLPPKKDCDETDYNEALEAAKAYYAAREEKIKLSKEDELFAYSFALVEQHYNNLNEEYIRLLNILTVYKNSEVGKPAVDATHLETTQKYQKLVDEAAEARNKYKSEVRDVEVQKRLELDKKIAEANRNLKDARDLYEELSEKILIKWRNDPAVESLARKISSSITAEYELSLTKDEMDNLTDDTLILDYNNHSLLRIKVSSQESEEFVADVLDRIIEKAPFYVEINLEKTLQVAQANCTVMSTLAHPSNSTNAELLSNVIVYGAVGVAGSLLVHAVIIVIVGLLPPDLQPKKKNKKSKADKKETENAA